MKKLPAWLPWSAALLVGMTFSFVFGRARVGKRLEDPVTVDGKADAKAHVFVTPTGDTLCVTGGHTYLIPLDEREVDLFGGPDVVFGAYAYTFQDMSIWAAESEPYGDWHPHFKTEERMIAFTDLKGRRVVISLADFD